MFVKSYEQYKMGNFEMLKGCASVFKYHTYIPIIRDSVDVYFINKRINQPPTILYPIFLFTVFEHIITLW